MDGSVLFPVMPYQHFRHMSDEDIASVVVYLRTLPPARHQVPPSTVPFVLTRLVQSVPQPVSEPVPSPDQAGTVKRGEYLASMGANITPDASGIGYYDEALFIQTLRSGMVRARRLKGPMPWPIYRNMTDDDLKSVFAYLRTLKPVHHLVDNTELPTLCKRCNQRHGLGDRN